MNNIEYINNMNNDKIVAFFINHTNKFISIYLKRGYTYADIIGTPEIKSILNKYKKQKYISATYLSGDQDSITILEKLIMNELSRTNSLH